MTNEPVNNFPRLRPVDVRPYTQDGRPYLLLRDPLQLGDQALLVPQPLAAVLAFCDGHHDAAGMAAAFMQRHQIRVDVSAVEELLAALDVALLLDNETAREAERRVLEEYRRAPFRTPLLAGAGYPADPGDLHGLLQDYLEAVETASRPLAAWPERVGLLSPHIDYRRGGHVYAQVWKHAAEAVKAAELVVLFGTDHYGDDPITLTRQSYATPYGVLPTDQTIVDALAAIVGPERAFAGELRHRREHSLELVAVWLHHMREGRPVPVVPVLTGAVQCLMANGASAHGDDVLTQVLDQLSELGKGKRMLIVASGDLAHVGPEFGGAPLDGRARHQLRCEDDLLLSHLRAGDGEEFYATIQRSGNRNNVCGVSPIYVTLRLLANGSGRPIRGEHVGYATCPADPFNTSVVTVCGMAFA